MRSRTRRRDSSRALRTLRRSSRRPPRRSERPRTRSRRWGMVLCNLTRMSRRPQRTAKTADEIKALGDGIVQLDKDVAEATENRKEENDDFKNLMASDSAAKEVIAFAK